MEGSHLDTREFREGIKRMGADSDYKYKSVFDPMLSPDIKAKSENKSEETKCLLNKPRLVVIASPSGSGKSSTVSEGIGEILGDFKDAKKNC